MEYAIALIVLAAVVALVVTAPLRRRGEPAHEVSARRAELEAAKEARYREIREAELDFRAGKMSEADWRSADRELRRRAIAILRELDELDDRGG